MLLFTHKLCSQKPVPALRNQHDKVLFHAHQLDCSITSPSVFHCGRLAYTERWFLDSWVLSRPMNQEQSTKCSLATSHPGPGSRREPPVSLNSGYCFFQADSCEVLDCFKSGCSSRISFSLETLKTGTHGHTNKVKAVFPSPKEKHPK